MMLLQCEWPKSRLTSESRERDPHYLYMRLMNDAPRRAPARYPFSGSRPSDALRTAEDGNETIGTGSHRRSEHDGGTCVAGYRRLEGSNAAWSRSSSHTSTTRLDVHAPHPRKGGQVRGRLAHRHPVGWPSCVQPWA